MFAIFAIAALVASAQAGLVGAGYGLGHGYGLGVSHGVIAAPAIAKVASPIVASSAITTRSDVYTPIIGKTLAPVGVAKVGYAAAPVLAAAPIGLGYAGHGLAYGHGVAGLW